MKHNIARPDLFEFDFGSNSKKVVPGPLALASFGGRNVKPMTKVNDRYQLEPDSRYAIIAITDCYIAIGGAEITADATDVIVFAKTSTVITNEERPTWKWLSISGNAQVIKLA